MSETTTQQPSDEPQPNAPSVDPPAPQQELPLGSGHLEAPEPPPEPTEEQAAAKARDEEGRRIAGLRARLGAQEREAERLRAEAEHYRRLAAQLPPQPETPEMAMQRMRQDVKAEVEAEYVARRFHDEGRDAYPDWDKRCKDLIDTGADGPLAKLLVETPGGVKIAAALAEDPAAVQRIAAIPTVAGRAVALGKYAALMDTHGAGSGNGEAAGVPRVAPTALTPPPVTRAPAPIRPVTGRASPVFNEYTATGDQLIEHYMKQNLERQQRR